MKHLKTKSFVITLLIGLFAGGSLTYAAGNWFDSLLSKSSQEVTNIPRVNYESLFKKDVESLKQTITDEVGDITVEQQENLKQSLKDYQQAKSKQLKSKVVGEKLDVARKTLRGVEASAEKTGKKQIDEAYNKILAEYGLK